MNGTVINSDKCLLDQLREQGVIDIFLSSDRFGLFIREVVDDGNERVLLKHEVQQLINDLAELHAQMNWFTDEDPNLYTTGPDYDY